ncbi:MAG: hypothetical protein QM785_04080 [Pyrinomonadaceae bacterium]
MAKVTVIDNLRRVRMNGESKAPLARAAVRAILKGMDSVAWEDMMKYYAREDDKTTIDQKQLDRLCGRQDSFLNSTWGKECLVYIASNSTCGDETVTMTGTLRTFTPQMRKQLEDFEDSPSTGHDDPPCKYEVTADDGEIGIDLQPVADEETANGE